MHAAYHHPSDIFDKASTLDLQRQDYALAVVTSVNGGAMRAPGALMLINSEAQSYGYISNGCVDADIIMHAMRALDDKTAIHLRYGEGSPFKDIALPCGGSIEIMILPKPNPENIAKLSKKLNRDRQSLTASYSVEAGLRIEENDYFSVTYNPVLTLRIVGRGAAVPALAKQSISAGFRTIIWTNDPKVADGPWDITALNSPLSPPTAEDDPWTAIVLLFHDHDWESAILQQALSGSAFYIGAMGSRKTHENRRQTLAALGVSGADIDRIIGPIGLIPSLRDANFLALSTLAQIVEKAQTLGRL